MLKAKSLSELREYLPKVKDILDGIDARLWTYAYGAIAPIEGSDLPIEYHGNGDVWTVNDCVASVYELMCIRKALRKFVTYPIDVDYAQRWLRAIEGSWTDGVWVSGGVKFDTPTGAKHVQLMPFQVWFIVTTMVFMHDVCMERDVVTMPSEYIGEHGMVYDRRRICTEADLFETRKSGKTELGGSMCFAQFSCMGDSNEQVAIVANDANQAIKIAYKAVKAYALQIDPSASNKLGGKVFKVGASSMQFREGLPRTASVTAFAAGGKPRDGFNCGFVLNDEAGQGRYINAHNDMESTVQELVGSGGVRRERLRLNTTTAGKVLKGPYREHLEKLEEMLLDEANIRLGNVHELPYDNNNALLLRLDPWDYNDNVEDLNKDYLFKRVNRAIGITVQPTWYRERIQKALTGTEDDKKEVLTKDFNLWQSEKNVKWIQPEEIRALQPDANTSGTVAKSIDELDPSEGWQVFVGQDFSEGNDLCGQSYLCVRIKDDGGLEFYADMDAWIAEDMLSVHPNRRFYEAMIKAGHLRVSPGKTIDEQLIVERNMEIVERLPIVQWGYDSYDAMRFVNAIGTWLKSTFDVNPQDVMRPVSQTYATYNSPVQELEYMVRTQPPLISFSANELWPWEFGAVALDEDKYENKKPVKSSRGGSGKVDNIQCLCSALKMYDDYIQSYNNEK